MAKVLQRPVGQFVAATFMITGDKPIGGQIIHGTGFSQHIVNCLALADIGYDDGCPDESREGKAACYRL